MKVLFTMNRILTFSLPILICFTGFNTTFVPSALAKSATKNTKGSAGTPLSKHIGKEYICEVTFWNGTEALGSLLTRDDKGPYDDSFRLKITGPNSYVIRGSKSFPNGERSAVFDGKNLIISRWRAGDISETTPMGNQWVVTQPSSINMDTLEASGRSDSSSFFGYIWSVTKGSCD